MSTCLGAQMLRKNSASSYSGRWSAFAENRDIFCFTGLEYCAMSGSRQKVSSSLSHCLFVGVVVYPAVEYFKHTGLGVRPSCRASLWRGMVVGGLAFNIPAPLLFSYH